MTPEQHIAAAETAAAYAEQRWNSGYQSDLTNWANLAQAHALIAVAMKTGATPEPVSYTITPVTPSA